jgi:ribosomal protein S2
MKLLYKQKKNARTTKTIHQLSSGINNLQAEQDNMLLLNKKEQQQLVAIALICNIPTITTTNTTKIAARMTEKVLYGG